MIFDNLPKNIPRLCQVVQGILIHIFWAERLDVKLTEERKQEVNIRRVTQKLAKNREVYSNHLTVARPLEKRQIGNCRDFTTMLCAEFSRSNIH